MQEAEAAPFQSKCRRLKPRPIKGKCKMLKPRPIKANANCASTGLAVRLTQSLAASMLRDSQQDGRRGVSEPAARCEGRSSNGGLLLEVPCVLPRSLLRWRVLGVGVYALPPGVYRHRAGVLLLWANASRRGAVR